MPKSGAKGPKKKKKNYHYGCALRHASRFFSTTNNDYLAYSGGSVEKWTTFLWDFQCIQLACGTFQNSNSIGWFHLFLLFPVEDQVPLETDSEMEIGIQDILGGIFSYPYKRGE